MAKLATAPCRFYLQTPGIQQMVKIDEFWCWHVFLKLLESKKWGKLTSFGVDMFFSNSCKSKNGENWLVLVLTCFCLKLLESKKWWKLTSFGVDMFFSNSCKSKNGENGLVLVLTCFFSNFWCWHVFLKLVQVKKWGQFTSFGVDMFFLKLLVLTCFSQTRASQKIGKID